MLKFQVDTIEGLDESVQKMYTEKDGKFTLAIEGLPKQEDVSGLKTKVEQLLTEAKEAKQKAKDAKKLADEATHNKAKNDGDIEALTASWETKYKTDTDTLTTERDDALGMLRAEKVHSKAVEMAGTLAIPGCADVLLPHITPRITMTIKDGRAVTEVLDAAGKPSALTLDELGKEFANNPAFAPLIVASNAAGGGANGKQGGGAAKSKTATRSEHDAWNPSQKQKFFSEGGTLIE